MDQSQISHAKAYWSGFRDGLREFAWWKDGCQFVGSCGTTLREALEDADAAEKSFMETALSFGPHQS